jgi:hypothetical protein
MLTYWLQTLIELSTSFILTRYIFLADFNKRSDLADTTLTKQTTNRNKHNQLHQSYCDTLVSLRGIRTNPRSKSEFKFNYLNFVQICQIPLVKEL